jgi:hypothetical protein
MEAPTSWMCIICQDLLNNPVTLPCCQNFLCKICLDRQSSLGTSRCPYPGCQRERLQNKIRTAEKRGKLYATEFWAEIQKKFPNFDYDNDIVNFVDKDDTDVGVIRREVNGEIRAEWEANEAKLKADRERRAKEEEEKLMKMAENPEFKDVAEDIKRNKEIAEQERLSLEFIKKLTAAGNTGSGSSDNNVNKGATTGIDMEEQKKIMKEIERRKNKQLANANGKSDGFGGNKNDTKNYNDNNVITRKRKNHESASSSCNSQISSNRPRKVHRRKSNSFTNTSFLNDDDTETQINSDVIDVELTPVSSQNRNAFIDLQEGADTNNVLLSNNVMLENDNVGTATPITSNHSTPNAFNNTNDGLTSIIPRTSNKWSCHKCTFKNRKLWLRCNVCGELRRPQDAV